MSFFYIGHRNGFIDQKTIAPTVFATDIYLYKVKAYWADPQEKFDIAQKMIKLGFFDSEYYYAGYEVMESLAEQHNPKAQFFYADKGHKAAQERLSHYAALTFKYE